MKRSAAAVVVAVIVVSLAGSVAHAQKVRIGAKVGASWSSLTDDLEDDYDDPRQGITGGMTVEIELSYQVAIETGLLYVQKGAKGERIESGAFTSPGSTWTAHEEVEIRLDYVEIPVLVKAKVGNGQVYVAGGLSLGFNVKAEFVNDWVEEIYEPPDTYYSSTGSSTNDTKSYIKDIDAAGVIGAGVSFRSGPGTFTLGVQYSMGLIDIDDEADPADAKNNVISVTVGYTGTF